MEERGGWQEGGTESKSELTMRGVRAKVRPRMSVGILFTNDLQQGNKCCVAGFGTASG